MTFARFAVLSLCMLAPGVAWGQVSTADAALARGNESLHKDDLIEAERWFLAALKVGADERTCYEKLFSVYPRLGRHDRAIAVGQALLQRLKAEDQSRRRWLHHELAVCYFTLGHYRDAEKLHRQALETSGGVPLAARQRLDAAHYLARALAKQNRQTEADAFWRDVETLCRAELRDLDGDSPRFAEIAWNLADALVARKEAEKAVVVLENVRLLQERNKDKRVAETLVRLSGVLAAQAKPAEAADLLREAHAKVAGESLLQGDIAARLAELSRSRKDWKQANGWRQKATDHYLTVMHAPGKTKGEAALLAFWKLQGLQQRNGRFPDALQSLLATDSWIESTLLEPRLRTEQGNLEFLVGSLHKAGGNLRASVAQLQKQSPINLNELPRALAVLGYVEVSTGDAAKGEALARQCLDLFQRHAMPEDLIAAEAHNLLGLCAAHQGEYAQAIARYRTGLEVCGRLGRGADVVRSTLLLNIALLHKAQGEPVQALKLCRDAQTIFESFAEPDDLAMAMFHAAQANILVDLGQVKEASRHADEIIRICQMRNIKSGPLIVTARHCQGLHHLKQGDAVAAEEAWQEVLGIQEQEKQALHVPRTLNYLALAAELQGKGQQAEMLYRRAWLLQKNSPRSFPVTRFLTSWQLAGVLNRKGKDEEARQFLEDSLAHVEAARLQVFGDAKQRAGFFGQFLPAIDDLVDSYIRAGKPEAAFLVSSRSRGRSLLDQLHLSGVDPRGGLTGPDGKKLLDREEALKKEMLAARARGLFLAGDPANSTQVEALMIQLDGLKEQYAETWREILNAHPLYRQIALDDDPALLLRKLRQGMVGDKTLLLAYHLGRDRGYAFLVDAGAVEAFPLRVSEKIAGRIADPPPVALDKAIAGVRGVELELESPLPPASAPIEPLGNLVALNHKTARAVIDHYRARIIRPDFETVRGIELVPLKPKAPVGVHGLEMPGHVFLPSDVLKKIKEARPQTLLVIPDGPLHRLPLEALVLESDTRTVYGLDVLPPISYAPSAMILARVADRPSLPARKDATLLTVGNPEYARLGKVQASDQTKIFLAGLGNLPALQGAALESARLRKHFEKDKVIALEGKQATRQAVAAAVKGSRFIHLAVHGLADERFGNLFGALALAPTTEDDGFLYLNEIHSLPLADCELAVLSACLTHVGPQQPLEAGVTLANAFYAAGARHVIASHWNVGDRSTAELMELFFKDVMSGPAGDASFARAFHKARQDLRATWAAPCYWAPFVVIGGR